jgi:hypothetical protein
VTARSAVMTRASAASEEREEEGRGAA